MKKIVQLTGTILAILFFIWIGMFIEKKLPCVRAWSGETTKAERVYVITEHRYFAPGDVLTTKENGALILWDSTMSRDLIVGTVTDSGTIKYKR